MGELMAFLVPIFSSIGSLFGGATVAGAGAAASTGFSLGSVLSVGSTLVGVAGTLASASAQSSAAKYNAAVKEQQANTEGQQAAARATELAARTRQRVAATRAGAVQNGFELEGSVADILNSVETQGALEGLTAIYDGNLRSRGLQSSAALDRSSAKNAITAGYLNAGTSLLSGFSEAYA